MTPQQALLIQLGSMLPNGVGAADLGGGRYRLDFADGTSREATPEEIATATPLAKRAVIPPVTRRQMLTALQLQGLLEPVKAYVAASSVLVQIAFNESNDFERTNPFLNAAAPALGKTDDDLDALFALARTL